MGEESMLSKAQLKSVLPVKSALFLAAAVFSVSAFAHHSAARFDFTQMVPITGKVVSIVVANPHIALVLEITNDDGSTKQVEFEGHSRNNVYRRGWRPDKVKAGDIITIKIAPKRNGEDGGYVQEWDLADGSSF